MRRRDFITILSGAAVLAPLTASAQEPGRVYRIGVLTFQSRTAATYVAFFDELRQLGFVEGQNLIVDGRGFGSRNEQFPELAVELAKARIDAFLCGGDAGIRAAQQATGTIPILGQTDDMVGSGLVRSLARPGGNTTGISLLATELDGKRQEILIEMMPGARRIATLADSNTTASRRLQALQDAARVRGVELSIHRIAKPEEVVGAIDAAKAAGAEAFNVLASPILNAQRQLVIERAAALRLPAIYQWPETAEDGGLAAYGPRFVQVFRQRAQQFAKVLRGTKPADLPVEQPTRFELVINLKTAKAIGHEVPAGLVLRADKVIE